MAYESNRFRRVGTRQVTLGVYEVHLSQEEEQRLDADDDREGAFAELLRQDGQTVNRVVIAERESAPIFFPDGPAPIVAHCESPEEVASMWIVYEPTIRKED